MAARPRVLVVEDDDAVREMLVPALDETGFEIVAALDGLHALRTAIAMQPDVVLLDLGLPNLDGSGYLEQWRERDVHARKVPVIVMSGQPYGQQIADELGAVQYFAKPFDIDVLIAAIQRHSRPRPSPPVV